VSWALTCNILEERGIGLVFHFGWHYLAYHFHAVPQHNFSREIVFQLFFAFGWYLKRDKASRTHSMRLSMRVVATGALAPGLAHGNISSSSRNLFG
jgi:hypothetical protein